MKKIIAAAMLIGASALGFAQNNQVDVTLLTVFQDLANTYGTGSNQLNSAVYGDQKSKYAPFVEPQVKYTYTWKIDDANTMKFGAIVDFYDAFYVGKDKTQYAPQWSGFLAPFAQYQGYGIDAATQLQFYTFSPSASDNYAAGVTAATNYNAAKYGPLSKSASTYKPSDSSVFLADNFKAIYKYSFDKTMSLAGGVEADLVLTPCFWPAAVVPQVSFVWGMTQTDVKFDLYNTYADDSSKQFTQFYLEPKFTYNFKELGVDGLKAYITGRWSAVTTQKTYTDNSKNWHDSRIQPGVSYTLPIKDVGTFSGDLAFRFNKVDNSKDTGSNSLDVDPYADLRITLGYSVKF